jgi:hypothetical protein
MMQSIFNVLARLLEREQVHQCRGRETASAEQDPNPLTVERAATHIAYHAQRNARYPHTRTGKRNMRSGAATL